MFDIGKISVFFDELETATINNSLKFFVWVFLKLNKHCNMWIGDWSIVLLNNTVITNFNIKITCQKTIIISVIKLEIDDLWYVKKVLKL